MRQAKQAQRRGKKRIPLAVRKRQRRFGIIGITVSIIFMMIALVSWASYWPRFHVERITFAKPVPREREMLLAAAAWAMQRESFRILSPEHLLFVPKEAMRETLKQYPWVQDVTVRADWKKRALKIAVKEKEPVARWCRSMSEKLCFLVDASGMRFYPATEQDKHLPLLMGGHFDAKESLLGSFVYPQARLSTALTIFQQLNEHGFEPTFIFLQDHQDIRIYLKEGPSLLVRLSSADPTALLRRLILLREKHLTARWQDLAYIDLRFGTRIFYKFKDQDDAQKDVQTTLQESAVEQTE